MVLWLSPTDGAFSYGETAAFGWFTKRLVLLVGASPKSDVLSAYIDMLVRGSFDGIGARNLCNRNILILETGSIDQLKRTYSTPTVSRIDFKIIRSFSRLSNIVRMSDLPPKISKIAKEKPRNPKLPSVKRDKNGFKVKRNTPPPSSAIYVLSKGLRKVQPYDFTYTTYCKKRWRGRTLLDVFTSEFRDKSAEQYKKALDSDLVLVNDQPQSALYVLKDGDLISHRTHKHEPPVSADPVRIVYENEDILVVDKPAGMPAHAGGRYKYNSVVEIIRSEKGISTNPCNRLDRLTSGLMFLAKTVSGLKKMFAQLTERNVEKWYIARVKGEFPIEATVDQPLETYEPRLTLNRVAAEGKPLVTQFRRVAYDPVSDTSIIECKPLTGRTHQIRVHLQFIGHPIANDPIYLSPLIWGPNLGKNGEADFDEVTKRLMNVGKDQVASTWINQKTRSGELLSGEKCEVCDSDLYTDPDVEDLRIWLHAFRYQTDNFDGTVDAKDFTRWGFETLYPEWALAPFRKYMELAIAEAAKCPPTTTAYSVGAVLVGGGGKAGVISTGYSRELPGNTHAEQNAIAKLGTVPENTLLFSTMEPCSLRLSGNLPCVDRVLQAGIQTVFVGVSEPDTFVKRNVCKEKFKQAGIFYIFMGNYEEEILRLARKGHELEGNEPKKQKLEEAEK